jgi:hypothetical protein
VTVSTGRGHAGYLLQPLQPLEHGGVDPAALLDLAVVGELIERGEQLLERGRPAAAAAVLQDAAARWRGEPFEVGDEWQLPRLCRAAVDRLDQQQRRLARAWARAGLLLGDPAVLDWIDQDAELAAALDGDREVWLQRFVVELVDGDPAVAERMLEQRRPQWGYDDPMTVRAAQLLELSEHGTRPALRPRPARTPDGPPNPVLADFVAAVASGAAGLLNMIGPAGPARADRVDELVELAGRAGVRVVRAVCDASDDLAPGRQLMRELWAAALTDPGCSPEAHRSVLLAAVASPRPSGPRQGMHRLVDAAVGVIAALARSRPVLLVIDDAHLLTTRAAALTEQIRSRLSGAAAAYAVVGADSGPYAVWRPGTVLAVPGGAGPPRPGTSDWLAAAAVTSPDGTIDPVAVAAVLGVPAERADAGLAGAVRTGAVVAGDPVRFAAPRVREEVLAGLAADPGRARRLHRAAHDLLTRPPAARTADPAQVARHALAARPDIADDVVAAACLAAVEGERAARRHDSAVEFAVRGLALTDDPELRFALQIAQGDTHHDRAEMRAAETAFRAAYTEAAGSPRRQAVAAVRLARRWSDPGRADPALLHLLESARDALGDPADPTDPADRECHELWLLLNANLAHKSTKALLPTGPDDEPPGVALARATLAALAPDTTPEVACEVLTECRWALFDFAPPAEIRYISSRLEAAAVRSDSDHFRGEALIQSTVDHLRLGELAAAQRASERHREHVERTGQGLGPWLQLVLDTAMDLWDGNLAAADERVFGPALTLLQDRSSGVSDSMQQAWMGQVFWLRREQGRAGELVGAAVSRQAERRQFFPVWSAALALLNAEVGQHGAAADQLVALLEQTDDLRALPPHGWSVPTLALLAEIIDSLGGYRTARLDLTGLARRVDALLVPHAAETVLAGWPTVLIGPVRQVRAQLALVLGDLDCALEHVDAAIGMLGAAPAQLARLRRLKARVLIAHPSPDRTAQARGLLAEVLQTATARDMGALVAAARRDLDGIGDGGPAD